MINCIEAEDEPGRVWITRSEPWQLGRNGTGDWVVLLEGKAGGFAVECLEVNRGKHMNKIKIKRKTALILNCIFTAAYLFFAFWVDWRIAAMIILFDVSRAFEKSEIRR
jgi:hypothetical protein